MKRNTSKMFVRGFIRSFFIILAMLIIGVISYGVVMHFWNIPEPVPEVKLSPKKQQEDEPITKAVIEDISKNLIFHFNDETGEIHNILLEIFHLQEKRMRYITIPVRTQFTMSETLYRKLVMVHPTIPQVIRLSNITKYFDKDMVYDYGTLIVEDLLGVNISYYTAIPESVYQTMFTSKKFVEEKGKISSADLTDSDRLDVTFEVFSEEYVAFLKSIETTDKLYDYIEEIYPSFQSNLSLHGKMNYLESYSKTSLTNVTFDLIGGINQNNAYVIDKASAKNQIESYIAGYKIPRRNN